MAVPMARQADGWPSTNLAIAGLCFLLAVTSAIQSGQLASVARTAIDGLLVHEAPAVATDAADLPAMDPLLARVVDPRPVPTALAHGRVRDTGIRSFGYYPRPGETLADVAARFGVATSTLLWNNGLEEDDKLSPGQRLTLLPMRGILHQVELGESSEQIAARYGVSLADLIRANELDARGTVEIGQVLVIPGLVAPTSTPRPTVATVPLVAIPAPTVDATATAEPILPAAATATAQTAHAARVATAVAVPDLDLPAPPGTTPAQREFILTIASAARESMRVTGVPASVTIAQAILESDWGRSRLARDAKNLFGIKAHTRPGTAGVYNVVAWEVINGANAMVPVTFKAYLTYADSIVDHGRWFHEQPRYAGALAVRDDPRAFARAINAAGYATDPAYASKLIGLMDRFNLYVYDLE